MKRSGQFAYTYPLEKATTAFGQGTAITPIQQVQALTAVANDGNMMKPHVIDKIVDPDSGETVEDKQPEVVGTPISEETAAQVREYLIRLYQENMGQLKNYAIEGYEVAGKTGTAQIPGNGGYLTGASKLYCFRFLEWHQKMILS